MRKPPQILVVWGDGWEPERVYRSTVTAQSTDAIALSYFPGNPAGRLVEKLTANVTIQCAHAQLLPKERGYHQRRMGV